MLRVIIRSSYDQSMHFYKLSPKRIVKFKGHTMVENYV